METTELGFAERLVLVFIVQSATLSIIAVSVFLGYAAYYSLFRPRPTDRWSFLRNPLDYFFLSLLFWDWIVALGAEMNILWVNQADVTSGSFCTTQAALHHIAPVGVALFTAAISIYTFLVIFMRWKMTNSRWLPLTIIGIISLFLILLPVVSTRIHTDPPFYVKDDYWCRIHSRYNSERIGMKYGLLWFVALLNVFLYVPLFFFLRGNIQVDLEKANSSLGEKPKFSWRQIQRDDSQSQTQESKESLDIAKQMLAYPIAYLILILPMSIVRWVESPNKPLPPVYTAIAGVVWSASGLVNVLLYLITRPSLFPSWSLCRRRVGDSGQSVQDPAQNTETCSEGSGADGTPEMTTLDSALPTGDNTGSRSAASHRIAAVAPPATGAPMLTDVDTDDEALPPPRGGITAPITPSMAS